MKILARIDSGEFVVYKEKWGVMIFQFFMALLCLGVGIFFALYVSNWANDGSPSPIRSYVSLGFSLIGYLFGIVGVIIIGCLPFRFRKMSKNNTGDELLRANKDGLFLSAGLGASANFFSKEKIESIEFSPVLEMVYYKNRKRILKNYIVIRFSKGMFEDDIFKRNKLGLHKTANGDVFLTNYPKGDDLTLLKSNLETAVDATIKINIVQKNKLDMGKIILN